MGIRVRFEMALRRFAHRRGWLWSPSSGWGQVPFGRHGVCLVPVNKRHAAMVIGSQERYNAAMNAFLGGPDEAARP